jgi:pyruvate dehydrogenase (quinone)
LRAAIEQGLKTDGPVIIDCVVIADEMPNFPHLELEKVGNYAIAKLKETLLAVTGR